MLRTSGTDQRLPESCFVVIAGLAPGANVAIARRGRRGVEVTSINFGDDTMARAAVRVVNEANGISVAVERAMLVGAMFGWDCELADPAFWTTADRRFNGTTQTGYAGSARIH
jgi:hypothetical protein